MNKLEQLKLEAEKYENTFGKGAAGTESVDFIAGATSKWVEQQKIEFAIEVLKLHIKHPCELEQNRVDILTGIEYLEKKLLEL